MNRSNLALLNNHDHFELLNLTETEVNKFIKLEWWQDERSDIYIDYIGAINVGLEFLLIEDSEPVGDLILIDTPLKRWNNIDGFYHA